MSVLCRACVFSSSMQHAHSCLLLGRGEESSKGRSKSSILSDAFEAVLGAIYIDSGAEVARTLVRRLFIPRLAIARNSVRKDFKNLLQEHAMARRVGLPDYRLTEVGPDHEKRYFATVYVEGVAVGSGEGSSKKNAEMSAAEHAWQVITSAADENGTGLEPPMKK